MNTNPLFCSAIICVLTWTYPFSGHATTEASANDSGETTIEVIGVGPIATDLVERVCLHLEKNLVTTVRRLPPTELSGTDDLSDEAPALEARVSAGTFALVALVMPDPSVKTPNVQIIPEHRLALVNAQGLHVDVDDEELYAQRLEKEAVAAVAAVAGLTPTPMPYCATYRYTSTEQLDAKARNLCPPQWIEFQKRASSARLSGHTSTGDSTAESEEEALDNP